MNNRKLIFDSISYIEENLRSDLSIETIARKVGFSYFYYSRLFKAITGISPSSYMAQRKIADSVSQLMSTDSKVIDIAVSYGYGSSEAFSRAFKSYLKQTPSEVRRHGLEKGELMLAPLKEGDYLADEIQPFREPEIVELKSIPTVGISFFYDFKTNKNDLTEQYNHLMSAINELKGVKRPLKFYQLQYWFDDQNASNMYFHIAVELEDDIDVPFYLTKKSIPKGKYVRFYHKGLANQVNKTYEYIYKEWLPSSNYRLPYNFCFEFYGSESLGPYNPNSISEIYIPIKKVEN